MRPFGEPGNGIRPPRPRELTAALRSTLIWTTDGLTKSATVSNASDKRPSRLLALGRDSGAAGTARVKPRELTRAAAETTSAAHATALRFIP